VGIQRHSRYISDLTQRDFRDLMPEQYFVVAFIMTTRTASTKSASFCVVARTIQNTVSSIRMSVSMSIAYVGGVAGFSL
jgi:hypothetical protein